MYMCVYMYIYMYMCIYLCVCVCVCVCVSGREGECVCVCVCGIQNKKQISLNISMFIFIFQIKSCPKYNGTGSLDLCAPIPLTIKLRKITKDCRCRTIQFNLGPGCPITFLGPSVSRRSLSTGQVLKSLQALTISVLK